MTQPLQNATQYLHQLQTGDASASGRLFEVVYDELRRLAGSYMRRQRADHTLQPTALVHEVFLRLIDQSGSNWKDRAHFMAVAAKAMRQLLMKHARSKGTAKRGGGWQRITLEHAADSSASQEIDIIALDDALTELAGLSDRQCRVVELRFFAGLTIAETSEVLGVGTTTVEDDWHTARAWLAIRMGQGETN